MRGACLCTADGCAATPPPQVHGPQNVILPDGTKTVAKEATPFLAMLPLADQTNAKDGHVPTQRHAHAHITPRADHTALPPSRAQRERSGVRP